MNTAYIQKRINEHWGKQGKLKSVAVGLFCERCGHFIKIEK
jgi:hypothetical protein